VKARLRVDLDDDRQPVVGHADVGSQQAISRGRLVHVAHQQGVKHHAQHGRRRAALQGEGVVLVKVGLPGGRHQHDLAAFGRGWVDVRKMGKPGRVADVPELGVSVGGPSITHEPKPEGQAAVCPETGQGSSHATILHTFFRS